MLSNQDLTTIIIMSIIINFATAIFFLTSFLFFNDYCNDTVMQSEAIVVVHIEGTC